MDIKEYLLQNIPDSKLVSGNKEILTRCIFCEEKQGSRHLYIKPPSEKEIGLYNCFKCNESGIVNSDFLRLFNIYDVMVLNELNKINKNASKYNGINIDNEYTVYRLNNNYISDATRSKKKLAYLNNRLGLNLSYEDLLENKIVLNLSDLLDSNRIFKYTRHPNVLKQLDEYFLGFISVDNAFINMRNLNQGGVYSGIDTKYVNYNIFDKKNNSQRYYVIPTQFDLYDPRPLKVHISEGPMDILSILYNLNGGDKTHSIYASIGGKAYMNIIKYFITKLGLINIELHIYPDADIDNYTIYNIANYLKPFDIEIYMHRNIYPGEKDMGVPLSRIKENIERIS